VTLIRTKEVLLDGEGCCLCGEADGHELCDNIVF
jgi:hypothetical protein